MEAPSAQMGPQLQLRGLFLRRKQRKGIQATRVKEQRVSHMLLSLGFRAFGPLPGAFLSKSSGSRVSFLTQIPGGLPDWQQCETSS